VPDESTGQNDLDHCPVDQVSEPPEADMSDSTLLEDALHKAIDAHDAGLLAAPFGVDEMALTRARRSAVRSELKRLAESLWTGPHLDSA